MVERGREAQRAPARRPVRPCFAENAARFHGARNRFTFHAGMGHRADRRGAGRSAAAVTPSKPCVEVDDGVRRALTAHGDATSGYSLYVKDGFLVHDLNIGGGHEIVTSNCVIAPAHSAWRRASGAKGAAGHGFAYWSANIRC